MTDLQDPQDYAAALPSGAKIPLLGIGTWQASDDEASRAVTWALETGYRHIDTATGYGNQSEVGKALASSPVDRADVFVTTKLPPDHAGRERQTLAESLDQLGLEYLDLWLIHWPPNGSAGVPTWREFIKAREEGLVKDIGVSNYSPAQLDELHAETGVMPAVNQIPWDPTKHDAALLDAHRERGVVLEGYSPFRKLDLGDEVLVGIGEKYGKSSAQVILRWHLQHGIVVIPKSAQKERIASNFDVFDFMLTAEDIAAIDALTS